MMVFRVPNLVRTMETNTHSAKDIHANAEDTLVKCMRDRYVLNAEKKYNIMIPTSKSLVGS